MMTSLPSFRGELPRLYELKDQADPGDPNAYFQNFEELLASEPSAHQAFLKLERVLRVLDNNAWRDLRERVAAHLAARLPDRGWQPLFDILNEAKGFVYLKSIGCTNVRFIPRTTAKTPDLEGTLNASVVLCEVKTINVSQEEAERRQRIYQGEPVPADSSIALSADRLRKIGAALNSAVEQLESHDPQHRARRIVFVVIHFDDWVGQYQPEYFAQIDAHLLKNPVTEAKLVFCSASNLFSRTFTMRAATVVDL